MRVGSYKLKNNLIAAPMAGVTDRPFRQLCTRLGAAMAVSEMISSDSTLWATAKSRRRADHAGEAQPISVQIAGADPAMMADAAKHNVDSGAQIIDINMGCPAKKVCNVAAGSALLRNEVLVGQILEAVVGAVDVPVTLKIRTGWDRGSKNALQIAAIAEAAGVQALTIHGRTRADLYNGEAEYDTIADVKSRVRVPIIANGDINSPQKAKRVLERTAADAVMIGRAAQGRPWIFREIAHFLDTGEELRQPNIVEVQQVLEQHLCNLYAFYGEYTGVRIARKHISWYTTGIAGADTFRRHMNLLEKAERQLSAVRTFFAELTDAGIGLRQTGDLAA